LSTAPADIVAPVVECAPAKVNLFLRVTGRRDDGYHLLDSLVVFAAVHDRLRATPANTFALTLTGRFGAALASADDNLVLRAARLLAKTAGRSQAAALTLEKNLPVASGIGGGSADAAATLRALARLWDLSPGDLAALALRLGADVPACLAARPARMQGIGEMLSPAPRLPQFGLVLVNPGIALATGEVFAARAGGFASPATLPEIWADAAAMAADLAALGNDLEAPAIALCPAIAAALATIARLPGVLLARMSGSGATCFGLFASPEAAITAEAAAQLPRGWWSWAGGLAEAESSTGHASGW